MAEGETISKSARKRANKKAREAAEVAAAEAEAQTSLLQAPAAATPAAKAAVAKAAASKPPAATGSATKPAAGKAAAAAKAATTKAAVDAGAPAANPKSSTAAPSKATSAGGKTSPSSKAVASKAPAAAAAATSVEAEPAPVPKVEPAQKVGAKAKAEGKAKAASKKKAEPQPQEVDTSKKDPPAAFYEIDDGTGGDWELMTGMTKKQQRRKEKQEQEAAAAADAKASAPDKTGQKGTPVAEAPAAIPKVETKAKAAAKAKATAEDLPQAPTSEAAETIAAPTAAPKEEEQPKEPPPASVTITVPSDKIRIVIGQKGSKIKMIQEKTGVKGIDTIGELFTVTGTPEAVAEAENAIKELIEKGYTMMSYENGKEDGIMVHPSAFPDIIGKEGSVIRKIKDELNVEVNIPQVPRNNDVNKSSKKYRVALAGNSNDVEKAKAVISDIVMYYHNEITHPEMVHAEMDVPDWALRFLIGRAGSELRHIQNNYKVRVAIPREHSANDKVVIVGEAAAVERAKVYAEKVIESNSQPKRDTAAESDVMGEAVGDEEPWMRAYMYNRGKK